MPKVEPFDKYTIDYEVWFERNRAVYLSELQAVRSLVPKHGSGIEIGVGTGRFASPLEIKLGLEPSASMARMARERGLRVVSGVAEALPLADNRFDFVLMVTTVCFLDNPKAAFREIGRILKPSGYFIAGFIDKNSPVGRSYEKTKKENKFYREAVFYSVDEILSLMRKTGFEHFEFMQTIFDSIVNIEDIEPVTEGYGRGSFIVVRGQKPK